MKKSFLAVALILFVGFAPLLGINLASAQIIDGLISSAGMGGVVFDLYGKAGYQRLSLNLNVPTSYGNAIFGEMDVRLAKQDFAIGSLGVSGLFGPRFALFVEASVSAQNSGTVETSFPEWFPFSPNVSGRFWSTREVRWWEMNLGGSLNILDSGVLLLGYKLDRLTQKLRGPSDADSFFLFGYLNSYDNDFFGDLNIQTWSPYIGVRFEDQVWRFDLIWSPWLTSYRAQMPLRFAESFSVLGISGDISAESRYGFGGRGGNLLEAYGEAKFNFLELLAAKLWVKASWLNCRGNGDRDSSTVINYQGGGSELFDESASATGSLSRYLWALGITGNVTF